MKRFFIKLSYDGAAYHGWQAQNNANTVQIEIEKALGTIFKHAIALTGAGRTDTGVHARNYFAHFDYDYSFTLHSLRKIVYQLNCILPHDIVIHEIIPVLPTAHARFDAISRTYRYYITTSKQVFNRDYSIMHFKSLNIDKMNEAANYLLNVDDFTSFTKIHSHTRTNICKVSESFWNNNNQLLIYTITADRFLRNMVRSIVGTLLEVGNQKITMQDFIKIIESKKRSNAGFSVPAKGLFLEDIKYHDSIFYTH